MPHPKKNNDIKLYHEYLGEESMLFIMMRILNCSVFSYDGRKTPDAQAYRNTDS